MGRAAESKSRHPIAYVIEGREAQSVPGSNLPRSQGGPRSRRAVGVGDVGGERGEASTFCGELGQPRSRTSLFLSTRMLSTKATSCPIRLARPITATKGSSERRGPGLEPYEKFTFELERIVGDRGEYPRREAFLEGARLLPGRVGAAIASSLSGWPTRHRPPPQHGAISMPLCPSWRACPTVARISARSRRMHR